MAVNGLAERHMPASADAHVARIAAAGSASHPYVAYLACAAGPTTARDFDDMVHLLCSLYGRHPGLFDLAVYRCPAGPTQAWLTDAANAFERERLYLVRLAAAVGPLPSTPGNAETEAALLAQRHALETLAQSERSGCALGAATALVSDWQAVRPLLDRAAVRVGVEAPACALPDDTSVRQSLSEAATGPATERAIRFGSEQLLLQHRALFDLLEARSEAREGY
ncbi:DUF6975 family protein [Sphingomonas sp. GCM10030256]|uniref:DUF6975 family protein n=1 Tax=Sphingomonas sp. GCM10030256 TaxID=3273427 RepID=UPI003608F597